MLTQTAQILTQLFQVTEELGALLERDDAKAVIQKLGERATILAELREKEDLAALAEANEKIRAMIGQIRRMDETYREVVDQTLEKLTDSIADLGNERRTLKDWQSLASVGKKPIVDLLY